MNWRCALAGLTLVLLATGGSACTAEVTTVADAAGGPSARPASGPTANSAATAVRVGASTPEEPVSISLPDGTTVPVRSVSTTVNGLLDVPDDIRTAGWWRGGSQIGDPFGSTLISAHVDSRVEGLGSFAGLLEARPGEQITVRTKTLQQTFAIRTLRLRPKGSIGPRSALHSPDGSRRLTLVTCAPPFVPALRRYANLAVVVATPVGEPVDRVAP